MVKILDSAREADMVQKAGAILDQLLGQIPDAEVSSNLEEMQPTTRPFMPDLTYRVRRADGSFWTLIVECRSQAEPRQMRLAAFEMMDRLRTLPGQRLYPVLVAPFISETSARICEEAGIGYVDLAGNARLVFDMIYIVDRGHPNPEPDRRKKSLFGPRASRVLRIMLSEPSRRWKGIDLADAAGVSTGQVSNTRAALIEQEWADVSSEGVYLSNPRGLMDAWIEAYRGLTEHKTLGYTLLHGSQLDEAVRETMGHIGHEHLLLCSSSAAKWLAPFARNPMLHVYADAKGSSALIAALKLQFSGKGSNVIIMTPRDAGVFHVPVEPAPGMWCTSAAQTILDLAMSGERGMEAGQFLLEDYLAQRWKMDADGPVTDRG